MNEKRLREEKELLKIEKTLGSEFVAEIRSLKFDELNQKLFQLAKYEQEIITAKNQDDKLLDAKELVKELNTPYREALTVNRQKARLVGLIIAERESDE
jgi:hypothetical protein